MKREREREREREERGSFLIFRRKPHLFGVREALIIEVANGDSIPQRENERSE